MIYYFHVPDMTLAVVTQALRSSLCPAGAEIRAEGLTGPGIVAITTPGVWLADRRGAESGLGVPGWTLVGSEPTGLTRDAVEDGKAVARQASPTTFVRA